VGTWRAGRCLKTGLNVRIPISRGDKVLACFCCQLQHLPNAQGLDECRRAAVRVMVRSYGVICCLVCSALWRRLEKQDSHLSDPRGSTIPRVALSTPVWNLGSGPGFLVQIEACPVVMVKIQTRHVRPRKIRQDWALVSQPDTDVDDFSKRANVHGTGWIRHHVDGLDSSSVVSLLGVVAQPAVKTTPTDWGWSPERAAAGVS
jgi:hypothetical protein